MWYRLWRAYHFNTILDINPNFKIFKIISLHKNAHLVQKCIIEGGKRNKCRLSFKLSINQSLFLRDIDNFLKCLPIKIL